MGVFNGPRIPGSRPLRRGASTVLGAYGRTVLAAAERVGPRAAEPTPLRRLSGLSRTSRSTVGGRIDARSADIVDLRRLALEATLAASDDRTPNAQARLADVTVNLSDWASGRLLAEAAKMQDAAVEILTPAVADGRPVTRRQFDVQMRQRFPWLGDVDAAKLFDNGTLASYRIRRDGPAEAITTPGTIGRIGSLVGRLRSRS